LAKVGVGIFKPHLEPKKAGFPMSPSTSHWDCVQFDDSVGWRLDEKKLSLMKK
jgi:hypothetical protein